MSGKGRSTPTGHVDAYRVSTKKMYCQRNSTESIHLLCLCVCASVLVFFNFLYFFCRLSALSTPLLLLLFKTRLFTPDLLLHSDTDTICKQSLEAMQPCVIKQEGLLFVDAEDAASTASCSPLNTR